jgi:hypothetical protein
MSVSVKYAFNQLKIRFRVPQPETFSVLLHSPTERKRPRGAQRLRPKRFLFFYTALPRGSVREALEG